ncbi:MAG: ABC transporter transmembrane domain-containing protein, partial [Pollutimonas bauzanensis]
MKTETIDTGYVADDLPDSWRASLADRLSEREIVISWLMIDLDAHLRYASGLLVVTDRQLLAKGAGDAEWQAWSFRPGLALRHHDHAGVGTLELRDSHARLAVWRYTLGHHAAALHWIACFERQRDLKLGLAPPPAREPEPHPEGAAQVQSPPSTWALLRLWRFAKPYRLLLLTGFLLTLASTAAALVAPYLTMPLMDKVLIPFQNGVPIDWRLVQIYLGALLGSSLLAWLLGWGRTYILAWVSERIGADLRTSTYEHLQKLSLQYYGGKRTGDLIARIGSESDRICVFLSLHL